MIFGYVAKNAFWGELGENWKLLIARVKRTIIGKRGEHTVIIR